MANRAAYLMSKHERPFVVKEADMPIPKDNQVVVKVRAAAVNPVDAKIQELGIIVEEFPSVLGVDMAGEVHAVGSLVKNVKVGDRVIGSCDNEPEDKFLLGVFQYYAVTHHKLIAKIPDSIAYTDGAVLPLGMATAGTGLFDKRCMGLQLPNIKPKPTGETLLVWGGASSVGSCAIQLGNAAGYEVIATASKKNFDYCKSIGAKETFDYSNKSTVEDILAYLKGKKSAGAFCSVIDMDSVLACAEIARLAVGHKRVGTVQPETFPLPEQRPKDVDMTYNFGTWLKNNEVGDAIFGEWIPQALATGVLKCKPDAKIIGEGLEKVQDACDAWSKGVSAEKIVVVIQP